MFEMAGSSPSGSDYGCRLICLVTLSSSTVDSVGGFHNLDLGRVPLDMLPCLAARVEGS